MSVELKITFGGSTPGLEQHRLSMRLFAKALQWLPVAFQETASNVLREASEGRPSNARRARPNHKVRSFDLELVGIEAGSAVPVFECVERSSAGAALKASASGAGALDLESVVSRFLKDLEDAQQGKISHRAIQKYLAALPPGIQRQRYTAERDSVVLAEVSLGQVSPPPVHEHQTRLIQLRGQIISVGFPPGPVFIGIKTDKRIQKCEATIEQANQAVELRSSAVTAAVLDSENPKLLWIRAEDSLRMPTLDESFGHIMSNWPRTLEILSK